MAMDSELRIRRYWTVPRISISNYYSVRGNLGLARKWTGARDHVWNEMWR